MRMISALRTGAMAMAVMGVAASAAPAFAQSWDSYAAPAPYARQAPAWGSHSGPYSGYSFYTMTHNAESSGG